MTTLDDLEIRATLARAELEFPPRKPEATPPQDPPFDEDEPDLTIPGVLITLVIGCAALAFAAMLIQIGKWAFR